MDSLGDAADDAVELGILACVEMNQRMQRMQLAFAVLRGDELTEDNH